MTMQLVNNLIKLGWNVVEKSLKIVISKGGKKKSQTNLKLEIMKGYSSMVIDLEIKVLRVEMKKNTFLSIYRIYKLEHCF